MPWSDQQMGSKWGQISTAEDHVHTGRKDSSVQSKIRVLGVVLHAPPYKQCRVCGILSWPSMATRTSLFVAICIPLSRETHMVSLIISRPRLGLTTILYDMNCRHVCF